MGLAQAGDPPDPEGGGTRRRSTGYREAPPQRLTQHPLRHEVQVVPQRHEVQVNSLRHEVKVVPLRHEV